MRNRARGQSARNLMSFKKEVGTWAMHVFSVVHDKYPSCKMSIELISSDVVDCWVVEFFFFEQGKTLAIRRNLGLSLLILSPSTVEMHAQLFADDIVANLKRRLEGVDREQTPN